MLRSLCKRAVAPAIVAAFLAAIPLCASAQLPRPTYGWNLGNTMEPPSGVGTWGGPPTKALIDSVARAGFNVVRIPCAWDVHADQTTHLIDPAYMAQVKQVVDWCLAKHLTVIVNDHWDDGWLQNHIGDTVDPAIDAKVNSYWTQIAKEFSSYGPHLIFAGANEPAVKTAAQMATLEAYYETFIDAVRGAGGQNKTRWLAIEGPDTDIDKTAKLMTSLPADPTPGRLIVEVHYYTPYQFCLMSKDASWGKMAYFWGAPYHSAALPDRNATWGEESYVDSEFQKMQNQFGSKGIPVLLGEFAAMERTTADDPDLVGAQLALHLASRTYYDHCIVTSANAHGMYPVYWDTPGSAELFNWSTGAVQDPAGIRALTGGPPLPPPPGTTSK